MSKVKDIEDKAKAAVKEEERKVLAHINVNHIGFLVAGFILGIIVGQLF